MLWSQQPNNFHLNVQHRKEKSLPCHELVSELGTEPFPPSTCAVHLPLEHTSLDMFDRNNKIIFVNIFSAVFQY